MKANDDDMRLLLIDPQESAETFIDDELTKCAQRVFSAARPSDKPPVRHVCCCGVRSENVIRVLPGGVQTSALMVHYIALHRSEVSAREIEKLRKVDAVLAGKPAPISPIELTGSTQATVRRALYRAREYAR